MPKVVPVTRRKLFKSNDFRYHKLLCIQYLPLSRVQALNLIMLHCLKVKLPKNSPLLIIECELYEVWFQMDSYLLSSVAFSIPHFAKVDRDGKVFSGKRVHKKVFIPVLLHFEECFIGHSLIRINVAFEILADVYLVGCTFVTNLPGGCTFYSILCKYISTFSVSNAIIFGDDRLQFFWRRPCWGRFEALVKSFQSHKYQNKLKKVALGWLTYTLWGFFL